jgi:hypothetical protein
MFKFVVRVAGDAPGAVAGAGFGVVLRLVPRPVRCLLAALGAIGLVLGP